MKEKHSKHLRKELKGSITVEAAVLYPFFLLLTLTLIVLTVKAYHTIQEQACQLYKEVVSEQRFSSSERLRFLDTAFDFFKQE